MCSARRNTDRARHCGPSIAQAPAARRAAQHARASTAEGEPRRARLREQLAGRVRGEERALQRQLRQHAAQRPCVQARAAAAAQRHLPRRATPV